MRACAGAAVGIIPELMDVHSPLRRRIMAGDIVGDGGRRGFTRLFKGDGTFDLGVTTENCHCREKKDTSTVSPKKVRSSRAGLNVLIFSQAAMRATREESTWNETFPLTSFDHVCS